MTRFELHMNNWKDCLRCNLSENRQNIVLYRGNAIPCDILFVGEAPGESENVCGEPFVGPAGHLLNEIISESIGDKTYCITNLVACIPREEDGSKTAQPDDESIKICGQRLIEFCGICKPRLLVCVGKLAEDWLNVNHRYRVKVPDSIPRIAIHHPAFILRSNYAARPLLVKRQILILQEAVYNLGSNDASNKKAQR